MDHDDGSGALPLSSIREEEEEEEDKETQQTKETNQEKKKNHETTPVKGKQTVLKRKDPPQERENKIGVPTSEPPEQPLHSLLNGKGGSSSSISWVDFAAAIVDGDRTLHEYLRSAALENLAIRLQSRTTGQIFVVEVRREFELNFDLKRSDLPRDVTEELFNFFLAIQATNHRHTISNKLGDCYYVYVGTIMKICVRFESVEETSSSSSSLGVLPPPSSDKSILL